MSSLPLIEKIRALYAEGGNILEFLKTESSRYNRVEAIMISYDLQAGSYTAMAEKNREHLDRYTDAIKDVFAELRDFSTILEVGVGEATVMNPLMAKLDPRDEILKYGFDISWSRARYACENTKKYAHSIKFFTADLFEIPFPDNSIDVVYTSHSIEPNGGREKEALKELYRVARKYVVLLEPDYRNASRQGKARMLQHGYVRNLHGHAIEMGFDVLEHRPFEVVQSSLNPTSLTIIKIPGASADVEPHYLCPITKAVLTLKKSLYYTSLNGLLYPVVDGIPCLTRSAAILAQHFEKFN